MTYTDAYAAYVGQLMAAASGVPASVATVWAKSESGVNNNPYGLTNGRGQLYSYPTVQAGVQAAADWLLNPSSPYGGVRTAIKSGNAQTIANAIAASPWGPSGYYASAWPKLGLPLTTVKTATKSSAGRPAPKVSSASPASATGTQGASAGIAPSGAITSTSGGEGPQGGPVVTLTPSPLYGIVMAPAVAAAPAAVGPPALAAAAASAAPTVTSTRLVEYALLAVLAAAVFVKLRTKGSEA